jgi:hypothetical protein
MKCTIRRNAGRDDAVIETERGKTRFDFTGLSRAQKDGARELIVDAWCKAHGFRPVYER